MKITGAVLAAGLSSRMGQNKLLLPYKDHTVIEEVLDNLCKVNLDERMLIIGFEREKMEKAIKRKFASHFKIVYNDRYALGRSESIKRAVENISPDSDALLFMVGDKPSVPSSLIQKAIDEFKRHNPPILSIKTPAERGHPGIFRKNLLPELLKLEGDIGAHDLIAQYKDQMLEIPDNAVQIDIDTMEDYRKLTH